MSDFLTASRHRSIVASVLFTLFGGPGMLLVLLPWWMTRLRVVPGWNETAGWVLIMVGLVPLFESIGRFIFVGRGRWCPPFPPNTWW